ncbi:copper resistance CopC family protein [Tritonibacter multivorans]|uniref:copper resistance CopC family protein n=1 Tax=Tritonibacter multivorans TaxID=928856 RepID=UPI00071D6E04|nr:copper resistance CopC family protein [Tritonibacter multivorans]MDA7421990.1 copper resistance protein CopC [Tritonibacter multivorans]
MAFLAVCATLVSGVSSGVFAHARVDSSVPAQKAVIAEAPAEVSFTFTNEIRLTRVDMTHADAAAVPLDLGGQNSFARSFSLPLHNMGPGTYHIEWRGLAKDGHAMRGDLVFTVK